MTATELRPTLVLPTLSTLRVDNGAAMAASRSVKSFPTGIFLRLASQPAELNHQAPGRAGTPVSRHKGGITPEIDL